MRLLFAASLVVVTASSAHAGNKVKAELLCGTYVDGAVKDMVPSSKKPRLTDPVACALHMADDNSFMANIHTVRYAVDPASGKKSKIVTSGLTNDIDKDKDLELVMKPATADDNGEILFQPCEDFDVVASISDDRGVYFTKTFHVAQACPKPKPLKAQVFCYATNDDNRIDFPDKQKRSLDGYKVTCATMSNDPRFPTAKFWAQTDYTHPTMDDTNGHTTSEKRTGTYEEGEDESANSLTFEADDIPVCLPTFDIKLYVDDDSGAHLFAKTVTVKQKC